MYDLKMPLDLEKIVINGRTFLRKKTYYFKMLDDLGQGPKVFSKYTILHLFMTIYLIIYFLQTFANFDYTIGSELEISNTAINSADKQQRNYIRYDF